jgi:YegS/Rv2252/BmrU family lipid kinase
MKCGRIFIIINQAAARSRLAWPGIREQLARAGVEFDAHETRHAGDATARARAAIKAGYETIAVVGGDGTLSETAEGFFEEGQIVPINGRAALAILPAGTGNDFARGLFTRRVDPALWTNNLIAYCRGDGRVGARAVDVIHGRTETNAEGFICLNAATLGIGAEVAAGVARQKGLLLRLPGEARFVSAALGALMAWRERPVRVTVDDRPAIERSMNLLAVANGVFAGGGMMFAPDARVDDGLMNVLLAGGLSRASILRELPRIRHGGHLANPKVSAITATRVLVETLRQEDALPVEADGNLRGYTPAEFRLIRLALKVVLPNA